MLSLIVVRHNVTSNHRVVPWESFFTLSFAVWLSKRLERIFEPQGL